MIRIAAYGAGVNSTAMIIGLTLKGIRLDAILFSDTGAEKPGTYAFLFLFNRWLQEHGQVTVTIIRRTTRKGDARTLEQHCLDYKQLPSIAYGYKQCSQKFKVSPQEKWMNNYLPARMLWKDGQKVTKYVGFDAAEVRRIKPDDDKYMHCYPLIQWHWDRKDCKEAILAAGLCLPPKSSCFFCPNMKKGEILSLPKDLQQRAIAVEQNAQSTLRELKGLGRDYKWEDLLSADREQLKLFEDLEMYDTPCNCID
jgi:hypothetical protein